MKNSYIHSLTPLRGIAALWVVLFHIDVCIFYRDFGSLLPREATGLLSKGYLWVDFFFLLSGFVLAHVYGEELSTGRKISSIPRYLWARFARLYPLHIFTLFLLILAVVVLPYFLPGVIDDSWKGYFAWSALPSNLLFTHAMNQHVYLSWNMVSWSIGAEWWTYVVAIIFLILLYRRNLLSVVPIMLLSFACLILLVLLQTEKNLDITFNYGFFRCLFEFVIGAGLYEIYRQRYAAAFLARDSVFLLLLILILAILHWRIADLSIIPVFSMLILAASYNQMRTHRVLNLPVFAYLGKISYSIYLMHGIWFMVFWFSFPAIKTGLGVQQMPDALKLAYVFLFLSLTIGSAHISQRYIEVEGRRFLHKIF
jgi:peptidoglycan/LPS O-acetylase OafA/YrhL